jgi:hypothetical protein
MRACYTSVCLTFGSFLHSSSLLFVCVVLVGCVLFLLMKMDCVLQKCKDVMYVGQVMSYISTQKNTKIGADKSIVCSLAVWEVCIVWEYNVTLHNRSTTLECVHKRPSRTGVCHLFARNPQSAQRFATSHPNPFRQSRGDVRPLGTDIIPRFHHFEQL